MSTQEPNDAALLRTNAVDVPGLTHATACPTVGADDGTGSRSGLTVLARCGQGVA